jgi:hypothetical protein
MPVVQLPNGQTVQFPDGTAPEEMQSALDAHVQANPDAGKAPEPLSFDDKFKQGAQDPFYGAAQGAAHAMGGTAVEKAGNAASDFFDMLTGKTLQKPNTAADVDTKLQDREKSYQLRRATQGDTGVDWGRTAGNLPLALLLSRLAPANGLVGGAVAGGGSGVLQPVVNGGDNYWHDKLKQLALGAGTGGVFGAGAQTLGKVIAGGDAGPMTKALMTALAALGLGHSGAGVGTLGAFSKPGQDLLKFLLSARPPGAAQLGGALQAGAPAVGAAASTQTNTQ